MFLGLNIASSNPTTSANSTISFDFVCPLMLYIGYQIQVYFPSVNYNAPPSLQRSSLVETIQGTFIKVYFPFLKNYNSYFRVSLKMLHFFQISIYWL